MLFPSFRFLRIAGCSKETNFWGDLWTHFMSDYGSFFTAWYILSKNNMYVGPVCLCVNCFQPTRAAEADKFSIH